MNYINEYKKFINSYNFSDAVRVSIGIILPAVIFGYYGQLSTGILVSLGAMVTSTADVPGPIQRRMTGMVATILLIFIIASIIGYSNSQHILLGFIIAGLCFILTLIGIYGNRVNNIGFAGLLIMVLSLDRYEAGWQVLEDSLFLFSGGLWYILLSLALFRMRPYKIVQQALGDCIISIVGYLKIRSYFYDADVDYE
ncbi:MAG TPA: FUSC family membrane protein, partial [Niabella sp.]|nr:FUSC family membrane protein [Niabella sp.]